MGLLDDLNFEGTAGQQAQAPKADPAAGLRPLDGQVWARMQDGLINGLKKGETTHIEALDELFTWMPGYFNVWTGWMNEGKTEWIYQLLLMRAALAGKKSAIYSPENMAEEHIYNQLIHSLCGQNPDKDWREDRRLSMTRYAIAKDFVSEHFVIVYPPQGGGRTPEHLLEYFEAAISKHEVSHCLLDPWNTIDHSAQGKGGDSYLSNTLGRIQSWTLDTQQSTIVTAHPRQLEGMKHGQARPIPDSSHISGGQMWENMAHVVGTYYRPWKHLGNKNELYSEVAIYLHKVKSRKLCGAPGSIGDGSQDPTMRITYSWETGRYYFNGKSPLDCKEVEAWYIPAAEMNAHHAVPAAEPAAPTSAAPVEQPLRSATAAGAGFEAEIHSGAPAERFGPRQITSADLS